MQDSVTATPMVITPNAHQTARWRTQQTAKDPSVYHITWWLGCPKQVDFEALDTSWRTVIARYDTLMSTIGLNDGELELTFHPVLVAPAELVELPDPGPEQRAEEFRRVAEELHLRPFRLDADPPARMALVRIGEHDELVMTMHHIVVDGWGMNIFWEELSTAYQALARGEQPVFTREPASFREYVQRQHRSQEQGRWKRSLDHWCAALDGVVATTVVPDRPGPTAVGDPGITVRYRFSPSAEYGRGALAKEVGATPFSTMLAAWRIVLARGGESEVAFGVMSTNRVTRADQELVGFLGNGSLLRAVVDESASIRKAAENARDATFNLLFHQGVPYPVVYALLPPETRARLGNFKLILNYLGPIGQKVVLGDMELEVHKTPNLAARADIVISYWDGEDGTLAEVEYNTERYDEATVLRMMQDIDAVLAAAGRDADRIISSLEISTRSMRSVPPPVAG